MAPVTSPLAKLTSNELVASCKSFHSASMLLKVNCAPASSKGRGTSSPPRELRLQFALQPAFRFRSPSRVKSNTADLFRDSKKVVSKKVGCMSLQRSGHLSLRGFALFVIVSAMAAVAHGDDWPFVPLTRPNPPVSSQDLWSRNPVDRFVFISLERRELTPSGEAAPLELARRAAFDLTGLPLSPADQSFLVEQGYESLIDKLLSSPAFGERWARHWLDVVRYADTTGFKTDHLRPDAYRFRDYVIESFNTDLPYDRFVSQQIAGDELEPDNPDALIATGLERLYPEETTAANFVEARQNILDDVTDITAQAFMGVTLGCARCHDHKFDPMLQTDFYQLQACFAPMLPKDDMVALEAPERADYAKKQAEWEAATRTLRIAAEKVVEPIREATVAEFSKTYDGETRKALETPVLSRSLRQSQLVALTNQYIQRQIERRIRRMDGEAKKQYTEILAEIARFDAMKPPKPPTVMAIVDGPGEIPATYVLKTGDYRRPVAEVQPGFPKFLGHFVSLEQSAVGNNFKLPNSTDSTAPAGKSSGRRTALAKWLTDKNHPLTARVIVNRIWQHYFGKGIVASPNDFGAMGEAPSHRELLDYLASELVQSDWSLKRIHWLILTSSTYRQSSHLSGADGKARLEKDPDNRFLSRGPRKRLEGEAIRDAMLAVSGELENEMYGRAIQPELPESLMKSSRYVWAADESKRNRARRSVYVIATRNLKLPLFASYDAPDAYHSCGVRCETMTPSQSLVMLHGEESFDSACAWAGRLIREHGTNVRDIVTSAFLAAYARTPSEEEICTAERLIREQTSSLLNEPESIQSDYVPRPISNDISHEFAVAIVDYCHAILNSSEFQYID